MRRRLSGLALLWSVGAVSVAGAQVPPPPQSLLKDLKLDFAVPDSPAFEVLEASPSSILRPTTVRELAAAVADLVGSGVSITIPRTFAIEFSPGLLIRGEHLTVPQYQNAAPWYRLRLSAGTRRPVGSTLATQLGFGVRTSIIDKADLRTNMQYRRWATGLSEKRTDFYIAAARRRGRNVSRNLDSLLTPDERMEVLALDDSLRNGWKWKDREGWEGRRWNAESMDVAFALRAAASDSTASDLKIDRLSIWGTYSVGFQSWGQALFGVTGGGKRKTLDADLMLDATTSARVYFGTNQYKVFLEGQGSFMNRVSPKWLANSGGEIALPWDFWADFSASLEYDPSTRETSLGTHFSTKLGLGS